MAPKPIKPFNNTYLIAKYTLNIKYLSPNYM